MSKQYTLPVGTGLFGRVINANGEPVDNKGTLENVQRVSVTEPVEMTTGQAQQMFETGIKVIDLLAPLAQGGIATIYGEYGVGKIVVMDEIMYNLIHHNNGVIVGLTMDEAWENSTLHEAVQEFAEADRAKIVTLFEPLTDSAEVRRKLLLAGLTIAEQFQQSGRQVLLVADENVATKGTLEQVREWKDTLRTSNVPSLLLGDYEDLQARREEMLYNLDSCIVLRGAMAHQSLWPAVDRLTSTSVLLENGMVSAEHVQVAQQVRQLLHRYMELQDVQDTEALSPADRQILTRGQRMQKFCTQPFFITEAFTDIPGEYVPVTTTLQNFKDLLAGHYDDVDVEAFSFVGTIAQALAKAQK
ncbi:MAG: ATP synthase beta subunit C-terminal domain-containing protein [Ktedonobacteraceae bacterium]